MRLFDPTPELHLDLRGAQPSDDPTEFVEAYTYECDPDPFGDSFDLEDIVRVPAADAAESRACETVTCDAFGNPSIDEARILDSEYMGRYPYEPSQDPIAREEAFYQSNFRCYDPTTRRWLDQSPLGFDAGDSNLYR